MSVRQTTRSSKSWLVHIHGLVWCRADAAQRQDWEMSGELSLPQVCHE